MRTRSMLGCVFLLLSLAIIIAGCRADPCLEDIPLHPELALEEPIGHPFDLGYADPGLVTFTWSAEPLRCYADEYVLSVWLSDGDDPQPADSVIVTTRENSIEYPVPLEPLKRYSYQLYQQRSTENKYDMGRDTHGDIWTGPLCTSMDHIEPVNLIYPQNGIYSTYERFRFEDPNPCYIGGNGSYEIRIEADTEFETELNRPTTDPEYEEIIYQTSVHEIPEDGFDISYPFEWCKPYYWRVTTNANGAEVLTSEIAEFYFIRAGTFQSVTLVSPEDHAVLTEEELNFDWEEPSDCGNHFWYEIQVSEQQNFSTFAYQMPSNVLDSVTLERPKPDLEPCTQYYWRVMTDPPGNLENAYSQVRSFVLTDPQGPCPIQIPQITPLSNELLIITSTPTAEPIPPTVKAIQNLNCRRGPGPVYEIDDTLMKGESAPVEGRNEDSTWWHILIADHKKYCWVWEAKTEENGDFSKVPILEAPPTPEPTEEEAPEPEPVDCSTFKDEKTCELHPTCRWITSLKIAPQCTDK